MGKQLFGTDGIRGVAGEYPLDPATVHAFGVALGADLRRASPDAAGLAQRRVPAVSAGVVTTPGVAYLTRSSAFTAGVMISASHNPYRDNGIKVFSHSRYKLPDDEEDLVEREI